MYCSKCGKSIKENAQFCEHCGTRLKENKKSVSKKRTQQSFQSLNFSKVKERTVRRNAIILALVAFALLGIGGYIWLNSEDYVREKSTFGLYSEEDVKERMALGRNIAIVGGIILIFTFIYESHENVAIKFYKDQDEKTENKDYKKRLEKLKEMYKQKEITKEEYDSRRQKILDKMTEYFKED